MRRVPGTAQLLVFYFGLLVLYQGGNYVLMSLAGDIGLLLGQVGLLVVPAFAFARLFGPGVRRRLRLGWPGWGALGAGAGLALTAFLALNQLELWSDALWPMPEELQRALEQLLGLGAGRIRLLVLAGLTAGAGLGEEIVFRGLIQSALEVRVGPGRAILIAALLFAAMHLNPWWFAGLAAIGCLLGVIAWAFDSIWPAALAHAVHNGLAYGLLLVYGTEVRPAAAAGPLLVAASALVTAMAVLLLVRRRRELDSASDLGLSPGGIE